MTGILIMLNNYFHDLAAAVLVVSAITLFAFARAAQAPQDASQGVARYFLSAYARLRFLIVVSLLWILAGGVVRTWAYRQYEWLPAAGRGQVPALVVKHVLILAAVVIGIRFWRRTQCLVSEMKREMERGGFNRGD